jgi:hypothetical protein
MTIRKALCGTFLALGLAVASSAQAAPILGGSVYATGTGPVIATFLGSSAGYDSTLSLWMPHATAPFFHNHLTAPGTTFNLGTFAAGTELIFKLHVINTGYDYYTGPAWRNPDNIEHAVADDAYGPNTTWVGFEDLHYGGDRDFNDLEFAFLNSSSTAPAPVPEPATMTMLGLGLAGIAARKVRARKKA